MTTFRKHERLCSPKLVAALFNKQGFAVSHAHILLIALSCSLPVAQPFQVLFTVSKKKFPHAVDRNLIKRRMRESFRHNKEALLRGIPTGQQFALAIVYRQTEAHSFSEINNSLQQVIHGFTKRLA
ncbi:MAG: ribonuclease P protein component [Bacteroidia bacterium]|jgi:ribonuclease P protein component